ncbi:MAG: 6-bladed beta-propeller [Gemmatimonadales bacterium]|jgi:hypothetical protein
MKLSAAFLAPSFLVWLASCSGDGARPSVIRTDSAGVEIVSAGSEDLPLPWRFERLFALGGADSGPESFYRVSGGTVGADARGRIYVLDAQAFRVTVFDSSGTFLRVLGREGRGPGELSGPASLDVTGEGTVAVYDYRKGGLVRFGPDGETLPEILPFPFFPLPVRQRHFAQQGSEILVAAMAPPTVEGTVRRALLRVGRRDTTVLADVSLPRSEMVIYASCGGGLNQPRLFEPEISWAASEEAVVVSHSAEYAVDVLSGDSLARSVRRDLEVRRSTRDLAIAELGAGFTINFGQGPCTIAPEEMVDGRGYAPTLPWIRRLALAPGGELWVERREVGPEARGPIDVFDRTGAYVGTLPEDAPFPLVFLSESRMGASERDEFDVERLVVYRVDRGTVRD